MKITDYGALTSTQPDDVLLIVDVHDFTQAGTGSTKKITVGNLAAGVGANNWLPADNGLLITNYDPALSSASNNPITAGTVYVQKVTCHQPVTLTTLWLAVGNAGSGATSGSFIGLYDSTGARLVTSADFGASLTTAGAVGTTITSQALTAGAFYWVAFVVNLAVTQPGIRAATTATAAANAGLGTAALRYAVAATSQTSLPSSFTPASLVTTNASTHWVGGS